MNKAISFRRFLVVLCALAAGVVAEAVVYLPITDASLVDRSPIAIVGAITGSEPFGPANTAYRVSVERVLKGSLEARDISVAVPGSENFVAPGMPHFAPGDRVILFLVAYPDGAYRVVELMLGAFTEVRVKGSLETRAQRNLAGSMSMGETQTEPARDFETFAAWIESRARGIREPGAYERPPAEMAKRETEGDSAPYTFLGSPARWTQFDSGVTVPWVLRLGGSTLAGGGATAFQTALNAFTNEPNTNISFTYAGTNQVTVGLAATDGLNALLMNDPFDDIPLSYDCSAGGILARGGFFVTGTNHTYKGSAHRTILEGNIVTQNNADCALTQSSGTFGAQVLAHELGHAVGLGHACGDTASGACVVGTPQDDALMRASAHGGGRGATFSADDVAALIRLYQSPGVISSIPRLVNIATRGLVATGDNIMIGGFIVGGTGPKKVLIRGRGPSLADLGVPGTLADPAIRLFAGATPIDFNDNWESSNAVAIAATGLSPIKAAEAAILTTVTPGVPYTVHVTGVGGTSGIAIMEVFEMDSPSIPLLNIATRGPSLTGDNVLIAGFIIQGDAPQQVLINAKGPSMSLAPFNVAGALPDPTLELYQAGTATPIATNDNWVDSPDFAAIQATGNAPTSVLESSILRTLAPGAYTAIVRGRAAFQGIALVEVNKVGK